MTPANRAYDDPPALCEHRPHIRPPEFVVTVNGRDEFWCAKCEYDYTISRELGAEERLPVRRINWRPKP